MSIVAPDGTPIQTEEAAAEAAKNTIQQGVIPVTLPDGKTIQCPIVAVYTISPSAINTIAQTTAQLVYQMLEERQAIAKVKKEQKSKRA